MSTAWLAPNWLATYQSFLVITGPCTQSGMPALAAAAAAGRRAFSAAATNGDADGEIARGVDGLILPHGGGSLVSLMAGSAAAEAARSRCQYQVGAGVRGSWY